MKLSNFFLLFILLNFTNLKSQNNFIYHPVDSTDRILNSITDSSGNIYTVGVSIETLGESLVTSKYNSSGKHIWSSCLGVAEHGSLSVDYGSLSSTLRFLLCLDKRGNLFVAGSDNTSGHNGIIIKYNPKGYQERIDLTSVPACRYNDMQAHGVDVYITGAANNKTVVTKIDSIGDAITFSEPQNLIDNIGMKIFVDSTGNVYVFTQKVNNPFNYANDYLKAFLRKYNSAGTLLWTKSILPNLSCVNIKDVIPDNGGHFYVAASTLGVIVAREDYLILKLDTSGQVNKSVTYNSTYGADDIPSKIIFTQNDLLITGGSAKNGLYFGDPDILTVKYDTSLTSIWAKRITFGSYSSHGKFITTTANGFYVAGNAYSSTNSIISTAVAKCDNNGDTLWTKILYTEGIANQTLIKGINERNGKITLIVSSSDTTQDSTIYQISYNAGGTINFITKNKGQVFGNCEFTHCVPDGKGNLYLLGKTSSSAKFGTNILLRDYYHVMKLNSQGNLLWKKEGLGSPRDLKIDGKGYLYILCWDLLAPQVTGIFEKYDSTGYKLFNIYLDFEPSAMCIGNDKSVYISGFYDYSGPQGYLAKYTTTGSKIFEKNILGTSGLFNVTSGLFNIIYNNNSIYVAGTTADWDSTSCLLKFDTTGTLLWIKSSGGFIDVDKDGNIYSAAFRNKTSSPKKICKYSPAGNIIFKSDLQSIYEVKSVVLDKKGNFYVTGDSLYQNGFRKYVLLKYNSKGDLVWKRDYFRNNLNPDYEMGTDIKIDNGGNIWLTGRIAGDSIHSGECFWVNTAFSNDMMIFEYDSLGTLLYSKFFDGSRNIEDFGNQVIIDGQKVYVIGATTGRYTLQEAIVWNLGSIAALSSPNLIEQTISAIPETRLYPNPSSGDIFFKVELEYNMPFILDIFDITGRHVKSLYAQSIEDPLVLKRNVLEPGVYVYKCDKNNTTGKFIVSE